MFKFIKSARINQNSQITKNKFFFFICLLKNKLKKNISMCAELLTLKTNFNAKILSFIEKFFNIVLNHFFITTIKNIYKKNYTNLNFSIFAIVPLFSTNNEGNLFGILICAISAIFFGTLVYKKNQEILELKAKMLEIKQSNEAGNNPSIDPQTLIGIEQQIYNSNTIEFYKVMFGLSIIGLAYFIFQYFCFKSDDSDNLKLRRDDPNETPKLGPQKLTAANTSKEELTSINLPSTEEATSSSNTIIERSIKITSPKQQEFANVYSSVNNLNQTSPTKKERMLDLLEEKATCLIQELDEINQRRTLLETELSIMGSTPEFREKREQFNLDVRNLKKKEEECMYIFEEVERTGIMPPGYGKSYDSLYAIQNENEQNENPHEEKELYNASSYSSDGTFTSFTDKAKAFKHVNSNTTNSDDDNYENGESTTRVPLTDPLELSDIDISYNQASLSGENNLFSLFVIVVFEFINILSVYLYNIFLLIFFK